MDVVFTDVVTGICVALANHLKIEQRQVEDYGYMIYDMHSKAYLWSVIIDEHKSCISHFNV